MGNIVVVGHGYEAGHLTLEAAELLKSGAKVILHTGRCGCAQWLEDNHIEYETLDTLYEQCEDFDEHADAAVQAVYKAAAENGDVIYGVFDVRDRTVTRLLEEQGQNVRVVAGPPVEGALFAYAKGTVQLLEASDWENYRLSSARCALVRELDSRELASEVKLKLMDCYPEESTVIVRTAGGIAHMKLYNLDRMKAYDHRTCALLLPEADLTKLERYDFDRLIEVIEVLLGPDGCPRDREQTHESLRPYMIEEAYEVVSAIDEDDPYHLYDELGDMLLQIVLHAEIGRQYGEFEMTDVISAICEKMIHRHSHIFGSDRGESAEEVSNLWSRNKMAERGQTTYTESMRDVARSLPAMLRAKKLFKRLEEACRRKETAVEAVEAVRESVKRLENPESAEEAFGEVLLQMAALSRSMDADPEIALNKAADRMIERFAGIEEKMLCEDGTFESCGNETLRKYWDLVKLSDVTK